MDLLDEILTDAVVCEAGTILADLLQERELLRRQNELQQLLCRDKAGDQERCTCSVAGRLYAPLAVPRSSICTPVRPRVIHRGPYRFPLQRGLKRPPAL